MAKFVSFFVFAYLALTSIVNANDESTSSRFDPVAYLAIDLPSDSPAVPVTNNETIKFKSFTTNNNDVFEFDGNGVLTLKKTGLYSVVGNFNYQNAGSDTGNVGLYAALNGISLSGSPIFRGVSAGQVAPLIAQVNFTGKKGDQLTWLHAVAAGTTFVQPAGPKLQGFKGPINKTLWEPYEYSITYNGPAAK